MLHRYDVAQTRIGRVCPEMLGACVSLPFFKDRTSCVGRIGKLANPPEASMASLGTCSEHSARARRLVHKLNGAVHLAPKYSEYSWFSLRPFLALACRTLQPMISAKRALRHGWKRRNSNLQTA